MLESLFENSADIIKAAAATPLGIAALVILVSCVLAYFWFGRSSEPIRVGVLIFFFVGGLLFAYVSGQQTAHVVVAVPQVHSQPSEDGEGWIQGDGNTEDLSTAEQLYFDGVALYDYRTYDTAEVKFQESIELNTNYAEPYYFLGRVQLRKGECNNAINNFSEALNKRFTYSPDEDALEGIRLRSYACRAKIWFLKRNKKKAEEDFQKAQTLAVRNDTGYKGWVLGTTVEKYSHCGNLYQACNLSRKIF